MKIKNKKMLIIILLGVALLLVTPTKVNAGLQANKGGTALVNQTANNFFVGIRRMESQYGTLGKTATFDSTSYLDETSNGIDCHMILNTEYGTAALLAYSSYGSKPTSSSDTTTGNASGIYQLGYGKYCYTTGIYNPSSNTSTYTNKISSADARYYNDYTSKTSKAGDGVGALGVSASYPSSAGYLFVRGYSGALYSAYASGLDSWLSRFACGGCVRSWTLRTHWVLNFEIFNYMGIIK